MCYHIRSILNGIRSYQNGTCSDFNTSVNTCSILNTMCSSIEHLEDHLTANVQFSTLSVFYVLIIEHDIFFSEHMPLTGEHVVFCGDRFIFS